MTEAVILSVALFISGTSLGIVVGAVAGYRFAVHILSKMIAENVVKPEALSKTVRSIIGKSKKATFHQRLSDDEAEKMEDNSKKRHSDLVYQHDE